MADERPIPSLESTATEVDYRPPSGVAVAAILVAGLYMLIVLGTALTAIVNKRPALNVSLVLLAVPALALSIAARMHIKRSEGARIGMQLANAAWWMSVVAGVGFGAYLFASVVALRHQSERVAIEWFDLLKEGKVDRAFVMTIPPPNRQNINPADTEGLETRFGGEMLPAFRNSELVRFFRRNGKAVDVQPLGMSDWEQIDNGYRVNLAFLLHNVEGEFEVNLQLTGVEGESFAGRQWQVAMPQGGLAPRGLTPYGWLVLDLDREARGYAQEWVGKMQSRAVFDAILATLTAAERPEALARLVAWQAGSLMPIGPTVPPLDAALGKPVFNFLAGRDFFRFDRPEPETAERKEIFRKVWESGGFYPAGAMRLLNPDTMPRISLTDERVEYTFPIEIRLPGTPVTYAKGRLVMECDSPEFVREAAALRKSSEANYQASRNPPAGGLEAMAPRNWRVVRLESDLEPLQAPTRQRPNE